MLPSLPNVIEIYSNVCAATNNGKYLCLTSTTCGKVTKFYHINSKYWNRSYRANSVEFYRINSKYWNEATVQTV